MTKIRDSELLERFGDHLKGIRTGKGLSQEEVAYRADIPINQVGRIERGEVNTTVSTLFALAKGLEVPPAQLLSFEPSLSQG
ncbi:XRE family transcriptional regulator [Rufibacter immobilis]|uniref:XRE family transcriptional regulator n=1 Tax=Rufibacter immobilis TaxID=1348778 RepID=A0A3M9MVG1_9BACT|nr:helix-turn-helix transcriptional regulator [Rufibacter immobilis]RNI28913.1 XRE family transcriptional regulator [Rufibacter immobilis]